VRATRLGSVAMPRARATSSTRVAAGIGARDEQTRRRSLGRAAERSRARQLFARIRARVLQKPRVVVRTRAEDERFRLRVASMHARNRSTRPMSARISRDLVPMGCFVAPKLVRLCEARRFIESMRIRVTRPWHSCGSKLGGASAAGALDSHPCGSRRVRQICNRPH
jgi:hypothetical protein